MKHSTRRKRRELEETCMPLASPSERCARATLRISSSKSSKSYFPPLGFLAVVPDTLSKSSVRAFTEESPSGSLVLAVDPLQGAWSFFLFLEELRDGAVCCKPSRSFCCFFKDSSVSSAVTRASWASSCTSFPWACSKAYSMRLASSFNLRLERRTVGKSGTLLQHQQDYDCLSCNAMTFHFLACFNHLNVASHCHISSKIHCHKANTLHSQQY